MRTLLWQKTCHVRVWTANIAKNSDMAIKNSRFVYPNPTSNFVTVQANGMNHITVLNTIGQVVYDVDVDGSIQSLDMSQYGAGVYMVHVATENGVGVQRVVVK